MSAPTIKTCKLCGEAKPLVEMCSEVRKNRGGRVFYRNRCLSCERERSAARRAAWSPAKRKEELAKDAARLAQRRRVDIPRTIWQDSRRSDRKRGLENDLTREFIAEQIKDGCSYCGETEIRMTLDRIDNDQGHTQDNVVPACIRCNYTRRSMPYEAWLVLVPAMREARAKGLFGAWTGRARKRAEGGGVEPPRL